MLAAVRHKLVTEEKVGAFHGNVVSDSVHTTPSLLILKRGSTHERRCFGRRAASRVATSSIYALCTCYGSHVATTTWWWQHIIIIIITIMRHIYAHNSNLCRIEFVATRRSRR